MPFRRITFAMKHQYFSVFRKQQPLVRISHLNLSQFMQERNIRSKKEGLRSLVTFHESVMPQLEEQFRDDSHKIRFLCDAVFAMPWAKFPLSLTTTTQFTFYNFVSVLES